jgi:hypothetical protein
MKQKKHDRAWFEQKVTELGEAIEQLPDERQLELFEEIESEDSPGERRKETGHPPKRD